MRALLAGVIALALSPGCAEHPQRAARDLSVAGPELSTLSGVVPDQRSDASLAAWRVSAENVLAWRACRGANPAESTPLAPGSYRVTLSASNLGDDRLLVNLPAPAGAPEEPLRYFVMNGLGSTRKLTLVAGGRLRAWFLAADRADSRGSATLTISPPVEKLTVDAAQNALAWRECKTTPAELAVPAGPRRLTLAATSFSSAPGLRDPHLLLELPSGGERGSTIISLNGLGAFRVLSLPAAGRARAWLVAESASQASGEATLVVSAP